MDAVPRLGPVAWMAAAFALLGTLAAAVAHAAGPDAYGGVPGLFAVVNLALALAFTGALLVPVRGPVDA